MADDSIFEQLDPETAALLNVARATSPVEPHAGLFAAMTAAAVAGPLPIPSTPRRKVMLGKLITAKAFGIVGALALTGGVAAAATGTLPDPVQSPVAGAVEHVGVHIPDGNHGADVSDVAHDKSGDGEDNHGATVSDTAHDNHGQNKDEATTSTTEVGDGNSGPGNNGQGNANGHSKDDGVKDNSGHNGADDPADHDANDDHGDDNATPTTVTTVAGSTTPTTADDHGGDSGHNGGESEAGHGGHGSDD